MTPQFITALMFVAFNTAGSDSMSTMSEDVLLSVSPTTILDGLTSDIELRCSFTRGRNSSVASVFSISISHSYLTDTPVFNYVASIDTVEGHAHNITHDVSEISGSINNGPSYLSVRIADPSSDSAGIYKCDVSGFDQDGKPIELSNLTTVTAPNYDMDALYNEVNIMRNGIQDQERFLHTFLRRVDTMKESMFHGPANYSGHQYYLLKGRTYFMRSEAQSVCSFYGGYLAELDSHGEFAFLKDWLLRVYTDKTVVYTGATDENEEGVWVNEHNNTTRPSFDWGPNKPSQSTEGNCQCYFYWNLSDCLCSFRYTTMNNDLCYICEVP